MRRTASGDEERAPGRGRALLSALVLPALIGVGLGGCGGDEMARDTESGTTRAAAAADRFFALTRTPARPPTAALRLSTGAAELPTNYTWWRRSRYPRDGEFPTKPRWSIAPVVPTSVSSIDVVIRAPTMPRLVSVTTGDGSSEAATKRYRHIDAVPRAEEVGLDGSSATPGSLRLRWLQDGSDRSVLLRLPASRLGAFVLVHAMWIPEGKGRVSSRIWFFRRAPLARPD